MPIGYLNTPKQRSCKFCSGTFTAVMTAELACSDFCRGQLGKMSLFRYTVQTKHGISTQRYEEILKEQGSRCAICGSDRPYEYETLPSGTVARWYIDQDPKTGKVRGLLCFDCNAGLGKFRDDWGLLLKAASYISGSLA